MSFSSKHRRLSRRERYKRDSRNFKLIILFLLIGLVIYAIMERQALLFYLKTWYY